MGNTVKRTKAEILSTARKNALSEIKKKTAHFGYCKTNKKLHKAMVLRLQEDGLVEPAISRYGHVIYHAWVLTEAGEKALEALS